MNIMAKLNIFIIEAFEKRINGYKTFRESLIEGLSCLEHCSIFIITEESPVKYVTRSIIGNIQYIAFPKIEKDKFNSLESLISTEIHEISNMIFISNYYPGIFNSKILKTLFPKSRFIHVIHDLPWLNRFGGCVEKYIEWLKGDVCLSGSNDEKFLRYVTYDVMKTSELADISVCLCENTVEIMSDIYGIPSKKLRLIHNGLIDKYKITDSTYKTELKKRYGIPASKHTILCVGRLTFAKGADRLENMLKRIPLADVCLVYVGEDDIFNWIHRDSGFQVISLGVKNRDEMFEIYTIVDFGIIPSRYEQCSYVGIEMLMFGLPVFTTEAYGVTDMFTKDNSFILAPDKDDLIDLDNLSVIKSNARNTYLQKYNQDLMTKKWIDLIKNL